MALAKRNEVEGKEKVVMHDHGFRERKQRGDAATKNGGKLYENMQMQCA